MIDKEKIKVKLRKLLNREPSENEVENSKNDPVINCEIMAEDIDNLEKRVEKLESKIVI